MSRSTHRLASAFGLLAAATIVVGACGSAAPALSDPKEIVTAAARAVEGAKSVHVELTLDGRVNADLTGAGGPASAISLTGTTGSADVDIAAGSAAATFSVPALLGLTGDVIEVGGTLYYRTSLTGDRYQVQKTAGSLPVNPTGSRSLVDEVGDILNQDGVNPVKGEDVSCGSTRCYTVRIELTPAELNALGADGPAASLLPVDVGAASLNLTVRVEKDTKRLAGIALAIALGEQGSLTLDMAMSKWDQPVTISAPSPDQVQGGS